MHDRQVSRDPVHNDVEEGADDEPNEYYQQRCYKLKAFEVHNSDQGLTSLPRHP